MTNPDRDELVNLADELDGWHDCADGDVSAGDGHFRVVCVSDSEQQRLNLRTTLREASTALRRLASSPADAAMREAFVRVLASLAAAISILERTPKAKKAVASDKMFDTMLDDYRKALEAGRQALTAPGATTKSDGGEHYVTSGYSDYTPVTVRGSRADPSSTRSDVTVEIKHLISSARAFLAHFNPCDLAEDKSQQWQSLEHQCNRVERALLDQFEIRRK